MIKGIGHVFSQIGISAIINMTEIPFLTSDNPVIWFNPSISEDEMKPYDLQAGGPIVLIFPVTPNIIIYEHSDMRDHFACSGLEYGELSDRSKVEIINRTICRFAYKAVFSQTSDQDELIRKSAGESSCLGTDTISLNNRELLFFQNVFGKPEKKPKWVRGGSEPKTMD